MFDPEEPVALMTPDEFRAEYRGRGWTGKALAKRWKRSATWISIIGNDLDRDPHWDDAVRGLPTIEKKKKIKV